MDLVHATEAEAIAKQIAASDKSVVAIINIVKGCASGVWYLLDSCPGRIWGVDKNTWHPFLRQARNTTNFFQHIKGD